MSVRIAVGMSESLDTVEAFAEASSSAAERLGADCDLCLVFASAPHLGRADYILSGVHDRVAPKHLIGCGAGGVVGEGRELEEGPGAVVWAASMPEAEISTHHVKLERGDGDPQLTGLPEEGPGETMILLADPYTFITETLLAMINESYPGRPVLGGLASAAFGGRGILFREGDVHGGGAVACSISGVPVIPCVSQGAQPVGPEMTITAAEENVIEELASRPAVERLSTAIGSLSPEEQELARSGVMLGVVIDENRPDYERGDFLVRPLIGADREQGTVAVGERVKVGQTVRLHVRDSAVADEDLRAALAAQSTALPESGAAGALLFTCNGRGSHMFEQPDHDALAIEDSLGVPAGGFFCAGEIGPVGGRNFLHGFTATMAVFPAD